MSREPQFVGLVGNIAHDLFQKSEERDKALKEGFSNIPFPRPQFSFANSSEAEICRGTIRVIDHLLKEERDLISNMEMDKEILENRAVYFEKKEAGELTPDFWVVVAHGEVLIHTPDRQEALKKIVAEDVTNCFFARVGHEDVPYRVNVVNCEYSDKAYFTDTKITNPKNSEAALTMRMLVDTGAQICVLPQEKVLALDVKPFTKMPIRGVNSSSKNNPVYLLNVTLDDKVILAEVVGLPDRILGMNVLEGFSITMNNGTSMTITAL